MNFKKHSYTPIQTVKYKIICKMWEKKVIIFKMLKKFYNLKKKVVISFLTLKIFFTMKTSPEDCQMKVHFIRFNLSYV